MKRFFFALVALFSINSYAVSDSYLDNYPVGFIAENVVYDLMNANRDKLRDCHKQYLDKIPGAFDTLGIEFLVDPQGVAKPLKSEATAQPKEDAMNCLKSLVKNLRFPNPSYGIVFIRYDSDVDLSNIATIQTQELSRNAITLKPYAPQKVLSTVVDMYMPYYRGCFKPPYIDKKEPGKVTMKWAASEDGRAVDIQITSSIPNEKMSQCLTQVTEQQRYPSGYMKTQLERSFNLK